MLGRYTNKRQATGPKDEGRYIDPDTPFVGTCATCKSKVETIAGKARAPVGKRLSHFSQGFNPMADCYSIECPNCKAAVYLDEVRRIY